MISLKKDKFEKGGIVELMEPRHEIVVDADYAYSQECLDLVCENMEFCYEAIRTIDKLNQKKRSYKKNPSEKRARIAAYGRSWRKNNPDKVAVYQLAKKLKRNQGR